MQANQVAINAQNIKYDVYYIEILKINAEEKRLYFE